MGRTTQYIIRLNLSSTAKQKSYTISTYDSLSPKKRACSPKRIITRRQEKHRALSRPRSAKSPERAAVRHSDGPRKFVLCHPAPRARRLQRRVELCPLLSLLPHLPFKVRVLQLRQIGLRPRHGSSKRLGEAGNPSRTKITRRQRKGASSKAENGTRIPSESNVADNYSYWMERGDPKK